MTKREITKSLKEYPAALTVKEGRRFCGPDARNGADCAGFARGQAKGSGARIGATGSESKNCGS